MEGFPAWSVCSCCYGWFRHCGKNYGCFVFRTVHLLQAFHCWSDPGSCDVGDEIGSDDGEVVVAGEFVVGLCGAFSLVLVSDDACEVDGLGVVAVAVAIGLEDLLACFCSANDGWMMTKELLRLDFLATTFVDCLHLRRTLFC